MGLISAQGTKIPHARWCSQKKKYIYIYILKEVHFQKKMKRISDREKPHSCERRKAITSLETNLDRTAPDGAEAHLMLPIHAVPSLARSRGYRNE